MLFWLKKLGKLENIGRIQLIYYVTDLSSFKIHFEQWTNYILISVRQLGIIKLAKP